MKSTYLAVVVLSAISACYGQNFDFKKVERYKIQNSTPSVLRLMHENLSIQKDYQKWLARYTKANTVKYPSRENVNDFLKQNGEIISVVNNATLKDQLVLAAISQQLNTKDPAVMLNNYESVFPTSDLKRFYQRAVLQAIVFYHDTLYHDFVAGNSAQVISLVSDRLNLIHTINGEKFINKSRKDFNKIFTKGYGSLAKLNMKNPLDERVVDFAYNYYLEHKDNLGLTRLPNAQLSTTISSVETTLTGFEQSSEEIVKNQFQTLTTSIETLSANQKVVTEQLNDLSKVLDRDIKRLDVLKSGEMAITPQVEKEVDQLNGRITYLTNFVNSATRGTLNYKDLDLSLSADGIVKNLFPIEHDAITKGIRLVKETPTLSNAMDFASGVLAVGAHLGIDKKSIEGVNKFINYAKAAIQIGTGIARLATGDITAIFSIFSSIGSLFGGGPPPESPELQFMRGMAEQMNAHFQQIEENLAVINKNIIELQQIVVKGFRETAKQLNSIQEELAYHRFLLQSIDAKVTYSIYKPFNSCKTFESPNYSWNDFVTFRNETGPALAGKLQTCTQFLIDPVDPHDPRPFSILFTTNLGAVDPAAQEVSAHYRKLYDGLNDQYHNTFDYFKLVYSGDQSQALTSLLFPVNQPKHNHLPYYEMKLNGIAGINANLSVLSEPIDYQYLYNYTTKYLSILDYYLLNKAFEGDPRNYLSNLLDEDPARMQNRKKLALEQLNALKSLALRAMMQQAVVSGQALLTKARYTITNAGAPDGELSILDNVIERNEIFGRNFGVMVLNELVQNKTDYRKIMREFDQNPANAIANLNALLSDRLIIKNFSGANSKEVKININYIGGRTIEVPAPSPDALELNKMEYTPGFYNMLDIRDQLNAKILEVNYLDNVPISGPLNSKNMLANFLN